MIVYSGINKKLSNEAIFYIYDVSMKGMENQYLFNLQCFKHDGESQNVTSLLEPPIRIAYKYSQDLSHTTISNSLS